METSIGKMVPIMKKKDLEKDSLVLHAEEYNTLILDKKGFKNGVPDFPEIKAVENIAAWVDRKLFIHNLGHAASAYLGFRAHPEKVLIADVLADDSIRIKVRMALAESAAALVKEYPDDFSEKDLVRHIDDLLVRFQNRALGDTVFQVGRDLHRKLGREDRILGAARLCIRHGIPFNEIFAVFESALHFRAVDQDGKMFVRDRDFLEAYDRKEFRSVLLEICGLDPVEDEVLIKQLVDYHEKD